MYVSVRRLTPWYLLVVLTFAVVAAASVGVSEHNSASSRRAVPTPSFIPPTGFGGYNVLDVQVNQISARWSVPAASTKPLQFAAASTWIGIQQVRGPAFIQVGTTESAYGANAEATMFWSDTQRHFHPQELTEVKPGDIVAASMAWSRSGWQLRIRDLTDDTMYSALVTDDVRTRFTIAEYIQEDPAVGTAASDVVYPTTPTVRFDQLMTNRHQPTLVRADGTVLMSQNGIVLVPTAQTDDGFSLEPPEGEAAQYLRVASRADLQADRFEYDLTRWGSLSLSQRRAAVDATIEEYVAATRTVDGLAALPRGVKTDFAVQSGYLERELGQWHAQGLDLSDDAYRNFATDAGHGLLYEEAVEQVRASLGLPPP